MALTNAQIVDTRRFMGYSVSGNSTFFSLREPVYTDVTYAGLSIETRLNNLQPEEETVLIERFLKPLNDREREIQGAADNLDTDQAAVWKHNKNEIADRRGLFTQLRVDLCAFLGFPPGPMLATPNRLVRA